MGAPPSKEYTYFRNLGFNQEASKKWVRRSVAFGQTAYQVSSRLGSYFKRTKAYPFNGPWKPNGRPREV